MLKAFFVFENFIYAIPFGGFLSSGGKEQSPHAKAFEISFMNSNSLAVFSITTVAMPNAITATAKILVTFFILCVFRGFWFMIQPKYYCSLSNEGRILSLK